MNSLGLTKSDLTKILSGSPHGSLSWDSTLSIRKILSITGLQSLLQIDIRQTTGCTHKYISRHLPNQFGPEINVQEERLVK